jgi:hypothetical protein
MSCQRWFVRRRVELRPSQPRLNGERESATVVGGGHCAESGCRLCRDGPGRLDNRWRCRELGFGLFAGGAAAVGKKLTVGAKHLRLTTQSEFGDFDELLLCGCGVFSLDGGVGLQATHQRLVDGHLLDESAFERIGGFKVLFEGGLQFDLVF